MTPAKTQVLDAIFSMTDAFQMKDLSRVMQSYEAGAQIAFEPGHAVGDPDTVRSTFEKWFALDPRFDYAGHEVLVCGDLALHFAPWTMSATDPTGKPLTRRGLSVAVLRRQPDGRWLMVIDNPHGQHLLEGPTG